MTSPAPTKQQIIAALNAHIYCRGSLTERMKAALTAASSARSPAAGVTEKTIHQIVRAILKTGNWPIFETQDDNGLDEDQYIQFARECFSMLESLATTLREQPTADTILYDAAEGRVLASGEEARRLIGVTK